MLLPLRCQFLWDLASRIQRFNDVLKSQSMLRKDGTPRRLQRGSARSNIFTGRLIPPCGRLIARLSSRLWRISLNGSSCKVCCPSTPPTTCTWSRHKSAYCSRFPELSFLRWSYPQAFSWTVSGGNGARCRAPLFRVWCFYLSP